MSHVKKTPEAETLAAMVDAIRVFYMDHEEDLSFSEKRLINNLPTKTRLVYDMNDTERDIVYSSIRHIWKTMTGGEPEFQSKNSDAENLNGSYWMLPGGVMITGFNHFQAVKENKILVCSMLDINPLVFEKLLASGDTGEVISLVLSKGGVRVLISREKSEVVMQTNENSWPWAKDKLERMYHTNKIAKIIDLSQPYEGWKSGVTIRVV